MHTKDILAAELSKAGLTEMATAAASGWYRDFLSPLARPCMQLAEDLARVGAALDRARMKPDGDADVTELRPRI